MSCFLKSLALAGAVTASVVAATAHAQEEQGRHVSIELNAMEAVEGACRLSFLIQNGHGTDIAKAVYETVLFDKGGAVERLTLFDFSDLPSARPRVRQFTVPGLACDGLGRILINGAETCTAEGLPGAPCLDGLSLSSRTDVEFLG